MVVFDSRPVTIVRGAGTPEELRWETRMGGDFDAKALFQSSDRVVTGDELHCDVFDQPRVILRVKPVMASGEVCFREATLIPRFEWYHRYRVKIEDAGTRGGPSKQQMAGVVESHLQSLEGADDPKAESAAKPDYVPGPHPEDPVGDNPVPEGHPAHKVWSDATRVALEEVFRFNERMLRRHAQSPERLWDWAIELAFGKFQIWAKRNLCVVRNDRDARAYEQWLDNYLQAWIDSISNKFPVAIPLLKAQLLRASSYWKANAWAQVRASEQRECEGTPPGAPALPESPAGDGPELATTANSASPGMAANDPLRGVQFDSGSQAIEESGPSGQPGTAEVIKGATCPKRAAWFQKELALREWNVHGLQAQGGPDWKTSRKVLDGLPVSRSVLEKIVAALSSPKRQVLLRDIPPD